MVCNCLSWVMSFRLESLTTRPNITCCVTTNSQNWQHGQVQSHNRSLTACPGDDDNISGISVVCPCWAVWHLGYFRQISNTPLVVCAVTAAMCAVGLASYLCCVNVMSLYHGSCLVLQYYDFNCHMKSALYLCIVIIVSLCFSVLRPEQTVTWSGLEVPEGHIHPGNQEEGQVKESLRKEKVLTGKLVQVFFTGKSVEKPI